MLERVNRLNLIYYLVLFCNWKWKREKKQKISCVSHLILRNRVRNWDLVYICVWEEGYLALMFAVLRLRLRLRRNVRLLLPSSSSVHK
jgi:hypothetical protein